MTFYLISLSGWMGEFIKIKRVKKKSIKKKRKDMIGMLVIRVRLHLYPIDVSRV